MAHRCFFNPLSVTRRRLRGLALQVWHSMSSTTEPGQPSRSWHRQKKFFAHFFDRQKTSKRKNKIAMKLSEEDFVETTLCQICQGGAPLRQVINISPFQLLPLN